MAVEEYGRGVAKAKSSLSMLGKKLKIGKNLRN